MYSLSQLCRRVQRATSSHRLNYATVGLPVALVPEEAVDTGVVVLAPSTEVDLTFRVPPPDDIFIHWITVALWRVQGTAPTRTLTLVPTNGIAAAGAIASDVRWRWYDAGARRYMDDQEKDWSLFAGRARYPTWLQPPMPMQSSRVYTARWRNFTTATTFAVSMVLHGVRRRTESPTGGAVGDDTAIVNRLFAEAGKRGELDDCPLGQDYLGNVRGPGAYKMMPIPGGPFSVPLSSFDAPLGPTQRVILADRRYAFFAKNVTGRQYLADADFAQEDNILPVFMRMYDQNAQYWITNGWVPMTLMAGDAGRPWTFRPTWAWGRNANISFDYRNYHTANVYVSTDVHGWFRDVGGC